MPVCIECGKEFELKGEDDQSDLCDKCYDEIYGVVGVREDLSVKLREMDERYLSHVPESYREGWHHAIKEIHIWLQYKQGRQ